MKQKPSSSRIKKYKAHILIRTLYFLTIVSFSLVGEAISTYTG